MSAGGILQACIMVVMGLTMLMIMGPAMSSVLDQMSAMSVMNSSPQSGELITVAKEMQNMLPYMIALPLFLGAIMFIFTVMNNTVRSDPYDGGISQSVNTRLDETVRRANRQIQQTRRETTTNRPVRTVVTKRQELMELDASTLAPIKTKTEPTTEKKQEDTPVPNDAIPKKSRWESLE